MTSVVDPSDSDTTPNKSVSAEKTTIGLPTDSEDSQLRQTLQTETLKRMLETQSAERSLALHLLSTNPKAAEAPCLFCKHVMPSRVALFKHMYRTHGFNIGLLDNLVNVQEFLTILRGKLDRFVISSHFFFLLCIITRFY
jgi:hypothetical protein